MKKFIAFAGHKAARITLALVALLLIGGGLVAQNIGVNGSKKPERITCDNMCRQVELLFKDGDYRPILPDSILIYQNGKPYGVILKSDMTLGGHVVFRLPIGEYRLDFHSKDYTSFDDYLISVTAENINDVWGDNEDPFGITLGYRDTQDARNLYRKYFNPKVTTILVFDSYTGEPVSGVTAHVNGFDFTSKTEALEITNPCETDSSGTHRCSFTARYTLPDGYIEYFESNPLEYSTDNPNGAVLVIRKKWNSYNRKVIEIRKATNFANFYKSLSATCTFPANIRVGTNCGGTAGSCTVSQLYNFNGYVKATLFHEWGENIWQSMTDISESYKAAAVAIRTNSYYYVNNPVSSSYDVCNTTVCQVANLTVYSDIVTGTSNSGMQFSVSNAADNAVQNYRMRTSSSTSRPKVEYAAETNDGCSPQSCNCIAAGNPGNASGSCKHWGETGDGHFQKSVSGPPCLNGGSYPIYGIEYVGLGKCDPASHPRAMSQRGSVRWATGKTIGTSSGLNSIGTTSILPAYYNNIAYCKKTWTQILAHYYPYYILENCSTGATTTLANVSQICGANLIPSNPNFTRSNRTFALTGRIQNNGGTAISTQFTSRYYLSTNNTYSSNDILIATFTTNSLSSGGIAVGSLTTTVSTSLAPAGTYYLIFVTDATGTIGETSETDNTFVFSSPFTLGTSFMADQNTDGAVEAVAVEDNFTSTNILQTQNTPTCTTRVNGNVLTITSDSDFTYLVTRVDGTVVCNGKSESQQSQCELPVGIYFVTAQYPDNTRCVQKIAIFD